MKLSKFILFFIIISFLACNRNVSEIQRQYFVDDVKNIESLNFNYCVDNDGRINSVTIKAGKKDYKNQEKIKQVIENLKAVYFFEDSGLRNNCYDYTVLFVNSKYENKTLDTSKISKCKNFRNGTFKYGDGSFSESTIIRNGEIQTEKSPDRFSAFKVEWTNATNYTLTYFKGSNKRFDYLIGSKTYVEIIDIIDDQNYVYKATLPDQSIVIGIMKKINF